MLLMYLLLGEAVFGGLGTGLYSILMIALIAVFLGGLMVGSTPEYPGKKITAGETRLAALYALPTSKVVLIFTALAIATPVGQAGLVTNTGPRGFTEILFAYASCMVDNGQSMAGLARITCFTTRPRLLSCWWVGSAWQPWLWHCLGDSRPRGAVQLPRRHCPAIPPCSAPWCSGRSYWWAG